MAQCKNNMRQIGLYVAPPEFELVDELEEGEEDCSTPSGCELVSVRRRYSVESSVTVDRACELIRESVETSFDRELDDVGPTEDIVCFYQTSSPSDGEPFISAWVSTSGGAATDSVGEESSDLTAVVFVGKD